MYFMIKKKLEWSKPNTMDTNGIERKYIYFKRLNTTKRAYLQSKIWNRKQKRNHSLVISYWLIIAIFMVTTLVGLFSQESSLGRMMSCD
jgi:polyferredoxin